MEHRLRREHLLLHSETDASNEIYLKGNTRKRCVPDHPHCHSTTLVVFQYFLVVVDSVCADRNTTCTMIIHVRTVHRRCQAQIVAQDTEQKHGKHGGGAPLSSFPLLLVVVLAEHGGCLSSVDRDRELRIWTECEARRHECETRWTAYLERARSSSERV